MVVAEGFGNLGHVAVTDKQNACQHAHSHDEQCKSEEWVHLADELVDIDEQLAESRLLQNRYKALRTQYRSDIRRLTFIAEGDLEQGKMKHPAACP
jgi:hypothetical protein